MTGRELKDRFDAVCEEPLPLPGGGETARRHLRLFEVAREDVSLAKLAEAHWDAVAILAEAGCVPRAGARYAVWASEVPGRPLQFSGVHVTGEKSFCTGWGLVERALVTTGGEDSRLLELDVQPRDVVTFDASQWQTEAFRLTNTGVVRFQEVPAGADAVVGEGNFYLERPGFWHGAIGPAACWAGGVAGLLEYADKSSRCDAHTLAHLGAMHANVWAMRCVLETAGHEIDADFGNTPAAHERALKTRHIIEQLATDTLRRFARAYGPSPLVMHVKSLRRYQEVDLFMRQSHGERDLHSLAESIRLRTSA